MKKLLTLFFVMFTTWLTAQETIVTDRPTQSASAFVMPKGAFQVEYGFISEKVDSDLTNLTYGNFHLRYGLIEGVELRFTQNYQVQKINSETRNGISPLILGTKVHLVHESGARPQMSVIGQVTLKTGDNQFQPENPIPEFRLNFQNTISEKVFLAYNLGIALPKDQSYLLYSAMLGYMLTDAWTMYVEPYAFFPEGGTDHRFNAGFVYLAKSNLQFDIEGGIGLSDRSPDSFFGFGAAYLF